jgi:hypothetical protein
MDVHGVHKACSDCGELKELGEFGKQSVKPDGHRQYCRSCISIRDCRRERFPITVTEKKCYTCGVTKDSEEFYRERSKKTGLAGSCIVCNTKKVKKHRKDKPYMNSANSAKRRAAKIMRTAPWASKEAIGAVYTEAARLTKETGVSHHVDHSVPLQGVLVSGLHLPCNLQVMEGSENCGKGNKWNPWTGKAEAPCPQAVIELTRNLEGK